ncbi:MAG: tRNA uridine-5-carboxymethylaminomethyl(34) synthesis GTPase MnmE [Pseudomonadota bacterium]
MTGDTATIVSAATPPGVGGVAIVRLSGSHVARIGEQMLGSLPPPREARFRVFRDSAGKRLDEGLALYFPGPDSFTGESVLELHGHGGPLPVSMLVGAARDLGARLAEPGEFSRRAFLNGRLDLAQAEAIADLIAAGSEQAARAALRSLNGEFSARVNALVEALVQTRLHVEAAIDFPEEDIDFLADAALKERLEDCRRRFDSLLSGAQRGRLLRDGYQVVLVGAPNVGKSSLMNRLSGEDTAIVTEVAGTTRDILRETLNLDGLLVELIDTAGLRDDPDRVEEEGIRRARAAMQHADACLWVQDASTSEPPRPESLPAAAKLIVVRNKIDLSGEMAGVRRDLPITTVAVSAATGAGLDALRAELRNAAGLGDLGEGSFTARGRHVDALQRARTHFDAGRQALERSRAGELLAEELREAQQALGEITGAFTPDDLLGRIFSEFCIGK